MFWRLSAKLYEVILMAKHKKTRQDNDKMKKKEIIKGLIVSFHFFIVGLSLIADAVLGGNCRTNWLKDIIMYACCYFCIFR